MRTGVSCFRRPRSCLQITILLCVCTVLINFGILVILKWNARINATKQVYRSTISKVTHRANKGDPEDVLGSAVYISNKTNFEDVLGSAVYISNKTNFEDAFPPNSKRASTIDTEFIIGNVEICKDANHLGYIVVVHSAVNHTERRLSIRSTWGKTNIIQGLPSRTIFLVGQIEDKMAQNKLLNENDLYGDIIQGTFSDTHRNLTLKNVMGLKWLWNYCSNAKVVVKVDDDVFVDIFKVRELYFNHSASSPKQFICEVGAKNYIFRYGDFPSLVSDKKSCVSDDYFKGLRWYPMPWCFGFAVFMSMDLARELYQAALVTPVYPLDDVYVYGILASTVKGVTWRNEEERFSKYEEDTISNWGCGKKQPFIVGTFQSAATAQNLWSAILECSHK